MKKLINGFSNPSVTLLLFVACVCLAIQWNRAEKKAKDAEEWANCVEIQATEMMEEMYINRNK